MPGRKKNVRSQRRHSSLFSNLNCVLLAEIEAMLGDGLQFPLESIGGSAVGDARKLMPNEQKC